MQYWYNFCCSSQFLGWEAVTFLYALWHPIKIYIVQENRTIKILLFFLHLWLSILHFYMSVTYSSCILYCLRLLPKTILLFGKYYQHLIMYQWQVKPQIVMQFWIGKGCLLSLSLLILKLCKLWTRTFDVDCQQNSLSHYKYIQNYLVIIGNLTKCSVLWFFYHLFFH